MTIKKPKTVFWFILNEYFILWPQNLKGGFLKSLPHSRIMPQKWIGIPIFGQCPIFPKFGLMVDVDAQSTSKITMICRAGPRGRSQWGTHIDAFQHLKL